MKIPTTFFALAALAVTTIPLINADDYANFKACAKVDPDMNEAIRKFCNDKPGGDNMMVPGKWAKRGVAHGDVGVWVDAHCKPKQWLPSEVCGEQFRQVCAASGFGRIDFGRNGCQHFVIEKLKGRHHAKHKAELIHKGHKKYKNGG